ncbi:MFS transporter [Allokutzneria albata]|uniref:Multidrug efflux pump Tap n=1 Tax=Allokutzneria albata TaxID=211114 RepID=A0A1H0A9P3_ALLAB|nr:MFS transporter [Allokutzneria albata]SDN29466.1 Major Facilitator Superfamily protein [Allokutzneria albata]
MKRLVVLFLGAETLSLLGNSIAGIALPWLLLTRTGDAAAAGVVTAATGLPMLVAAIAGGVVIDRIGRRRISIGADMASAACVAALPVVDMLFGLDLGWFIVLGIAGAVFDIPGMTARETLLPDVAKATGMSLERLSGLRQAMVGTTLIAGPALGTLVLGWLDSAVALWVTAATSALAALLTWLLPTSLGTTGVAEKQHWTKDLKEAAAVLRGEPVLIALTVLSAASVLVMAPIQMLLLPAHFVAAGGSAGQFGPVIMASALGMIGGNLVYSAVGARLSRRGWLTVSLIASIGAVGWLAALPGYWWLVAASAALGLVSGPIQPLMLVLTSERVPEGARGRVFGVQNAVLLSATPVGVFAGGWLISGFGVHATGTLITVVWAVLAVGMLLLPGARQMEEVRVGADHR